jgi:hypothetical protein
MSDVSPEEACCGGRLARRGARALDIHTWNVSRDFFPTDPGSGLIRSVSSRRTLHVDPSLTQRSTSMTTTMSDLAAPASESSSTERKLLGRVAGALGLAWIVLEFAAVTQEPLVEHATSLTKLQHAYGTANLTRAFTGGYVEALAFVLVVPVIVIVARLFGRGSETTHVAAQSFLALGVAWVASTMAVGFAPGAAALYAAQHGADAHSIAMVNDIRNFSYLLQITMQGGMAVALGTAAILGRQWPRVVGWGGVVAGVAIMVGTPFANNTMGSLWMLWWICLAVLLIRGRGQRV